MLQRTLGSGWGVLLPGLLIAGLMYADLSPDQWRIVILMGLVLTPVMLAGLLYLGSGLGLLLVRCVRDRGWKRSGLGAGECMEAVHCARGNCAITLRALASRSLEDR